MAGESTQMNISLGIEVHGTERRSQRWYIQTWIDDRHHQIISKESRTGESRDSFVHVLLRSHFACFSYSFFLLIFIFLRPLNPYPLLPFHLLGFCSASTHSQRNEMMMKREELLNLTQQQCFTEQEDNKITRNSRQKEQELLSQLLLLLLLMLLLPFFITSVWYSFVLFLSLFVWTTVTQAHHDLPSLLNDDKRHRVFHLTSSQSPDPQTSNFLPNTCIPSLEAAGYPSKTRSLSSCAAGNIHDINLPAYDCLISCSCYRHKYITPKFYIQFKSSEYINFTPILLQFE